MSSSREKLPLATPTVGIINVHASLLPKYRGAAPVAYAILNGETTIGVTIIKVTPGLDSGDMILQDAQKEFDQVAMIGFGADGDDAVKKADFEAIRGTYDGNKFVKEVKAESEAIAAKGAKVVASLK